MFVLHPNEMELPLMYRCIIRILYWFGMVEHSELPPTWRWRWITFVLNCIVLVLLDHMALIALSPLATQWKIFLETAIFSAFSFVSICALCRKRRNFSAILYSNIEAFANRKFNLIAGCLAFLLVIHPFSDIAKLYRENHILDLKFFTYQMDMECKWVQFIIAYTKIIVTYFIQFILPSIVAVVYCTLCHQCCLSLKAITQSIAKCSPLHFTAKAQATSLKRLENMLKMLEDVQDVFSLVSFSVCALSFSSCLVSLSLLLTLNLRENFLTLIDDIFHSFVLLTSLIMIFWTAGGLPLEIKKFRWEFGKNLKKRALFGFPIEVPGMERLALLELDYEMTGCGLLFYRRSSILGVLGSILTYGLLILSIEIHQGEVHKLHPENFMSNQCCSKYFNISSTKTDI